MRTVGHGPELLENTLWDYIFGPLGRVKGVKCVGELFVGRGPDNPFGLAIPPVIWDNPAISELS